MNLTNEEIQRRREQPQTHGLRSAYATDGDERSLKPEQRGRLAELKEQLQTREGVMELLQERAAHSLILAEMGMSWVAKEHQSGINVWKDSGAMARLATFMGEARRTLEALARLQATAPDDAHSADAILERARNG